MHMNGYSGLQILSIIPYILLGNFACLEYVSKTMQENQMKLEILIAGNDRKCNAHKRFPNISFGVCNEFSNSTRGNSQQYLDPIYEIPYAIKTILRLQIGKRTGKILK